MARVGFIVVAAAFVAGLSAGCGEDQGGVRLTIEWPPDPSPPSELYVRGQLLRSAASSVASPSTIIAGPVGPIAYGDPVALTFPDVPNGPGRVIVLEVTESPEEAFVRYYARSEPFTLRPGRITNVLLELDFTRPPDSSPDALRVLSEAFVEDLALVRTSTVKLALETDTGVVVEISADRSFARDERTARYRLEELELVDATCDPSGASCPRIVPWDLDRGLPSACPPVDRCNREVHARFVDDQEFWSRPITRAAVVDRRSPALADFSVVPTVASANEPIRVSAIFTEPVAVNDDLLSVSPSITDVRRVFPQIGVAFESSHVFELLPPAGGWPTDALSFEVLAFDRVGRSSGVIGRSLRATIDASIPDISGLEVEPERFSLGETQGVIRFVTSEFPESLQITVGPVQGTDPDAPPLTVEVDPIECSREEPSSGTYSWSCPVDVTEFSSTAVTTDATVRVVARDAAGNRGEATSRVGLDFEGPRVTLAQLRYIPRQDNPIAAPTAARAGTTVSVTLETSETIRPDPRSSSIEAVDGDRKLQLPRVAIGLRTLAFETTVATTQPDGSYAMSVTLVDLAGNASDVSLDETLIEVRTAIPDLRVKQSRVSYIRAPAGRGLAESTGGYAIPPGPYFAIGPQDALSTQSSLQADTFSLTGNASSSPFALRFWADAGASVPLGSATPLPDGSWDRSSLELASTDSPLAFVTALDVAGNETAPVLVESNWFVATTAPRTRGIDDVEIIRTSRARRPRDQRPHQEVLPLSPQTSDVGLGAVEAVAERHWMALDGEPLPPLRQHGAAYHAAWGTTIVYGGIDAGGLNRDRTYEFDGVTWEELSLASPGIRGPSALAYDERRERVVLMGGGSSEIYELDDGGWRAVVPTSPMQPPAMEVVTMAYDREDARVVILGGPAGDAKTYTWDGETWAILADDPALAEQENHAMTYVPSRDELVLVGDQQNPGVWTYSKFFGQWNDALFICVPPPGADHAALAFDEARDVLALYGGNVGTFGGFCRTLLYESADGCNWSVAWSSLDARAHRTPRSCTETALTYEPNLESILAISGAGLSRQAEGKTWTWDGEQLAGPLGNLPPARIRHRSVFDSTSGQVVLFGGSSSGVFRDDTWEWDGRGWAEIGRTAPPRPTPRIDFAMTYDARRDRVVLFGGSSAGGGRLGDTWEWDGSRWSEAAAGAGSPGPLDDVAMAYDAARNETVLFGGLGPGGRQTTDTWLWDGAAWTRATTTSAVPPERHGHAMAYDSTAEEVVLFGGLGELDFNQPEWFALEDTWRWDGTSWSSVAMTSTFGGRNNAALGHDEALNRLLLFGGSEFFLGTPKSDLWQLRTATSTNLTPPATLPGGSFRSASLHYDPARGRMLAEAGAGIWELREPGEPGIGFTVSLPSDVPPDAIETLRFRAYCGGTHTRNVRGSRLWAWTTGLPNAKPGWRELGDNTSSQSLPSLIDVVETDPDAIVGLVTDDDRRIDVQCRPLAAGTGDPSAVALGYGEVRVRYTVQP